MGTPWTSGPAEILKHGLQLLQTDSESDRRLGVLAIDNAVELTAKTYLSLPKRVTGLAISRSDVQEIGESFPKLLDALEKHASSRLDGIDLGEVEWYHRLRNELYHQGNGLTVERDKAEAYAQIARLLFSSLFGVEAPSAPQGGERVLGEFIQLWVGVERALRIIAEDMGGGPIPEHPRFGGAVNVLLEASAADHAGAEIKREVSELRMLRNQAVHGQLNDAVLKDARVVPRTRQLIEDLKKKVAVVPETG